MPRPRLVPRMCWMSALCLIASAPWAVHGQHTKTIPLVTDGKPVAAVVPGSSGNPVERTALTKLQDAIRRDSGQPRPLAVVERVADAPSACVLIGTAKDNAELARIAARHQLPLDKLSPQGFLLRSLSDEDRPLLVIAGADSRGVLYGVQEAIDQVITCTTEGDVFATDCDITLKPALGVRGTYCLTCWGGCPSYDRTAWEEAIDAMADAGMNRVMFWMDGLFRSQRHPDAFLDKPGQHFAKAKLTNDDIHELIRFAHDRGMDFYFGSGVFAWFTAGEYFSKRFKDAADPSGNHLCPSSPTAQRVVAEYLSEMIEVFPEADGYMLEIRDELGDCMCDICQKKLDARGSKQFGQSEMDFLEKLTAAVWKDHPNTKFIWLIGYANHNEDVKYYERLKQIGRDPRMEWLEVRMSWTLSVDGGRKPLREFSDRIYHWDQYYRHSAEHMQNIVRKTVNEGLHGYVPAYEPGFANLSIYSTQSETPFPVRLVPFCITQFYYQTFTWHPKITKAELLERAHRKFFSAEVPAQFADDLMFLKQFMAQHHVELLRDIGGGLDAGPGLINAVENSYTVDRRGGDKTKKWLLESVAADIRRLQSLLNGKGGMPRLAQIEQRIAEYRPKASPRSRASMAILQRAIDDIRKELAQCVDYAREGDEALKRIDRYIEEIIRRSPSTTQPEDESG